MNRDHEELKRITFFALVLILIDALIWACTGEFVGISLAFF